MLTYRPVTEISDLNLCQPKYQICVMQIIHFSNTESGQVTFFKMLNLTHLLVSQEVKSNVQSDSPTCIASQEQCSLTHLPVSIEVKSNVQSNSPFCIAS